MFTPLSNRVHTILIDPFLIKPICLQSLTLSLCSCSGCNGNPSSKTLFKALTEISTQLLKSSKSNFPSFTKLAKFMEPSKQEPPAGKGSSYMLSKQFFICLFKNFRSYQQNARIMLDTSVNSDLFSIYFHLFWIDAPYSWVNYCYHIAHYLCVTFLFGIVGTRYYHIF